MMTIPVLTHGGFANLRYLLPVTLLLPFRNPALEMNINVLDGGTACRYDRRAQGLTGKSRLIGGVFIHPRRWVAPQGRLLPGVQDEDR